MSLDYGYYLCIGDIYEVNNQQYTVKHIQVWDIKSKYNYKVRLAFENDYHFFEVGLDKVINNPLYKFIKRNN